MAIESPNLDDRSFHDLIVEAKTMVQHRCPEWTDLSPNDPGIALLEVFAYLTDLQLYRLNRLPEKAYVELLRLIGLQIQPPSAAVVDLEFTRTGTLGTAREVPRGLRVTSHGGEGPVFTVSHDITFAKGEAAASARAYHAQFVEAEPIGRSNGKPGQSFATRHQPIVAPAGQGGLRLSVGVEMLDGDEEARGDAVTVGERSFRVWSEVDGFADCGPDDRVFRVDRWDGVVHFAPAVRRLDDGDGSGQPSGLASQPSAVAAVPPFGRDIVVWYWHGGGASGNVPAGTLTTLKDGVASGGIEVVNAQDARGGREAESLDNALRRGPLELFTLERAVTAKDYEALARRLGGVARARAFTSRALWAHAEPGSVEVVLVPELQERERATLEQLGRGHSEQVRAQVQSVLDARRPAGTSCIATWARYKRVRVQAVVAVHSAERVAELRERIVRRLEHRINPLPDGDYEGWPFGQRLKASHAYDAILAEPGVVDAEGVRFIVDSVPDRDVRSIQCDPLQAGTWFAGSGSRVFRSQNDAESWELVSDHGEGLVETVVSHSSRRFAGYVASALNIGTGKDQNGVVLLSRDSGETWQPRARFSEGEINDLAWTVLNEAPVLLVGTSRGLYQIFVNSEAGPELVVVDPVEQGRGIESVAVAETARRELFTAVAVKGVGPVFLSEPGNLHFEKVASLDSHDVCVLRFQYDGLRTYLWAGVSAIGNTDGAGCFRMEMLPDPSVRQWVSIAGDQWKGGTCHDLAFEGSTVMAASHRLGVMVSDSTQQQPGWRGSQTNAGLPLKPVQQQAGRLFEPVLTVAARTAQPTAGGVVRVAMVGGSQGVYRSHDSGRSFHSRANPIFTESLTLPRAWLFCSGDHDIDVRRQGTDT